MPRFQFSLRTLLIGVTLLAVPCWYVGWQAKIVRDRKTMLQEINQAGGDSEFWMDTESKDCLGNETKALLPWYRTIFGDKAVFSVYFPNAISNTKAVADMFPEASVEPF